MVALSNKDRGDPAESLGSHVRIGCRLDLTRGRHQRHQALLVGHFGRLYGDHTFVRLVHAEQHNSAQHYHSARPNRYFMPRLHAIPLRLTTLFSPVQTSAADFASSDAENEQTAREQMPVRLPLLYTCPSTSKCFERILLNFKASLF